MEKCVKIVPYWSFWKKNMESTKHWYVGTTRYENLHLNYAYKSSIHIKHSRITFNQFSVLFSFSPVSKNDVLQLIKSGAFCFLWAMRNILQNNHFPLRHVIKSLKSTRQRTCVHHFAVSQLQDNSSTLDNNAALHISDHFVSQSIW